jgi:hypothetical protein
MLNIQLKRNFFLVKLHEEDPIEKVSEKVKYYCMAKYFTCIEIEESEYFLGIPNNV